MLKILGIFYKKSFLAILGIAIVSFFFYKYFGTESVNLVSSQLSSDIDQEDINQNIKAYQPKYDWIANRTDQLTLTTDSAIIVDKASGQILYRQNEHDHLPPASITKILTMIVALENYQFDRLCTVSPEASQVMPNKMSLAAGEKIKVEDLIYGMMMISANDAAEVLAECFDGGREKFIQKMNYQVELLGLTDSHFTDPHGLDDETQYSSAFDMAAITRYALLSNPKVKDYIGRVDDYSIPATAQNEAHYLYQVSHLLKSYPGMYAAKTGYTHIARNTYVGAARRGEQDIVIVYFGAKTTTSDATTLLEYGLSQKVNL